MNNYLEEIEMKPIPGYKKYLATSDGHIYSKRAKRCLKESKGTGCYLHVTLYEKGTQKHGKSVSVHRLVAAAFCDKPNEDMVVNHINEVKTDNRAENLEWVTRSENQLWGKRAEKFLKSYGKQKLKRNCMRASMSRAKRVMCIENGLVFSSVAEAGRFVTGNVQNNGANITRSCKTGIASHGYHWQYVESE